MNAIEEKEITRALSILEHIEGTLVADLKTLKVCARSPNNGDGLGSLNYTLFLVGLIGCETLGRYVYGADLDKKNQSNMPDVGGYIIRFIDKYFPSKNQYKSISKILADYLRHTLVHGFAPRKDGYPFDLHLVVSKEGKDIPPISREINKRLAIKLDGISFLNNLLKAFDKIIKETKKDAKLAGNIVAAEEYNKTITPPKEVTNQFIASYPKLNKES